MGFGDGGGQSSGGENTRTVDRPCRPSPSSLWTGVAAPCSSTSSSAAVGTSLASSIVTPVIYTAMIDTTIGICAHLIVIMMALCFRVCRAPFAISDHFTSMPSMLFSSLNVNSGALPSFTQIKDACVSFSCPSGIIRGL